MNNAKNIAAMTVALVATVAFAGDSAPFSLRTAKGTRIASETEAIAYSTAWNNGASVRVTADGVTLKEAVAPASGDVIWDAAKAGSGSHTLAHVSGGEKLTAKFAVLGDDVTVHSGILGHSETWEMNKVHLVTAPLAVPSGVSLAIESGAVVKFMSGTSLTVESGGSCTAKGVVFTHVNDDTVGGDTLMDGEAEQPKMGDYALTGNVTDDDATEYRYLPPQTLTSSISSNTRLRGYRTYIVSNSVTVASGATLTLQPGTVLKFNTGCQLTVNGTLDAQGTRAAPIVFTSLKDDKHGGDTNGDGDKTYAQGGDWNGIWIYGKANIAYAEMMYSGNGNERGIIQTSGSGALTMTGCTVAYALNDGIWNWGGTISVTNTVFIDTGWATAPYNGSRNEFVNCIFYGNNVGMCYWSHWSGKPVYRNCIFASCAHGWCELNSGSYGAPPAAVNVSNCLFWNPVNFGLQFCERVGSNGNIWGDPKFVDAENGDFRIADNSPCINAGDSANAPEYDYYGQPRDGAPDIGIYELTGGMSANDLAVVSVSSTGGSPVQGDENAQAARSTIGDTLTISYSVANVGKQAISGSWRDKVSLVSADGGYSINLGTAVQTAALAVGSKNTFNASFTIPTDAEGRWRVAVNVNSERDIFEGVNVTNNAMSSTETLEISLPERLASDGFSGTATKGVPAAAKFALSGDEPMVVRVNAPAGTVVYFGNGFMPSASSYSARAVVGEDGGLIGIPSGVTSAYLLVETTSSKGVAFTMALESAALAVQSVSPTTLPCTGTPGLVIDGANFAESCRVELTTMGGSQLAATATTLVSPTRLTAQIDCSKLTAGATYGVKVIGADGATAVLTNAVTVANVPAAPKLKATLDAPESVRRGRTLSVYIDYENIGNADMPAPVFELISTGQVFKVDGNVYTNSVKVMGLSAEAPVGTLRPGEPQRLGVTVTILSENVKWKLRSYHAAQEGAKKRLQLEALMGDRWVRDLSKSNTNLYLAVCRQFGRTWAECYTRMGECLSEQLSENSGILTFGDAIEIFAKEAYENAKSSLSLGSGQQSASQLSTSRKGRLMGDNGASEGELTGTKYNNDNSHDGDVWWYCGAKWLSVTNESVKTSLESHLGNVFLICHGNANSVHEEWISNMAAVAAGSYSAVLAVDWGDGSFSHLALNPEKNSVHIPAAAREAIRQLKDAGIFGGNLTVCGHSHGGHLGGIIAKGMGARRLIGMDTSPIWTHKNTDKRDRYPRSWNGNVADTVEFYKTSWDYSMGTDPSDLKNGDVFGSPSFFVTQVGDFYKDAYKKGGDKHVSYGRALELHGYSHQWVRMNLGKISSLDWRSSSASWKEFSGYDGSCPVEQGQFAGVLRGVEMECGAKVKQRVAENMGVSADSIEWLYDRYVLGKDLTAHSVSAPVAKSAASSLPSLQERWLRISEHGLNSFSMSGANSSGVYELGGDGVELTMFIENYANNLSVDYNHSTVSRIEKPWQRGFGHLILVADVTDAGSAVSSVVNDVRAAGGASRLSWEKIMQLQNAGLKFAAVDVEGGGMMNEDVFLRPVSGAIRRDYFLPLPASVFPSGKTGDEEPRDTIVLGIVGVNANAWRKNGAIELYEGELCADNNCIAQLIKVKPKGPSAEVMSGRTLEFYWSATQVSAFAPENIQDDNTWTADENGNWTVTLTGAASYGPTNIVAGSWTGFDCTVSQREWTSNPNVTVTGHLFTGEDGDFVPAQDYTVILAVEDANGKIGTKEYQFTICRHTDEDDGEDEDEDDSDEPKSCDPNEMVGPEGIGENRLIKPGEWLTYTIYFENKSDAEAAAASVTVTNPLSDLFDWTTFEMLDVGFGNQVATGLSGMHEGVCEQVMDGTNTSVRTELTIDETTGVAEWYLRIVDPNGDAESWPLDVYAGFLPPNNPETHCGEGHLTYRIKLRDDAPGNIVITNSATIVFDYNEPITTDPAWWNTVAEMVDVSVQDYGSSDVGMPGLVVGLPYGDLPEPSPRPGYTFVGWYSGANGTGKLITADSIVEPDVTTLYGYWSANKYSITFDANGGEGGKSMSLEYGTPLVAPTVTREGYVFTGWSPSVPSTVPAQNTTYTAQWKVDKFTVIFDANGGAASGSMDVVCGTPLSAIPVPTWRNHIFLGWFTAAEGGMKVDAASPITGPLHVYAHWKLEKYVSDSSGGASGAVPGTAASVYDGYLYNGDEVAGTIQAKVAKPKKGKAKVTVAIQIVGEKKVSLKGEMDVDAGTLEVVAKDGRVLSVEFGSDGMSGKFGGYDIDGARNFFSSKDKAEKAAAEDILAPWLGTLNMITDGGTLSVTIAKKGKVTVKGTIDGVKVSAKAQALIGEEWICIPVVYSKKTTNLAFAIWLPLDGGEVEVVGMDAEVGKAGALKARAKFYLDDAILSAIDGIVTYNGAPILPDGESVSVSGKKWVIADGAKAAKVAYKKGDLSITPGKKGGEIANASGLKLSYKSKDGSFTGSFTVYAIEKGKLKKHKASVSGILIDGVGYGTATIKKFGSWAVEIR